MKYTKGPWITSGEMGLLRDVTTSDGGRVIAKVFVNERPANPKHRNDVSPLPEGQGNALLIAKAPAMYEALERIGRETAYDDHMAFINEIANSALEE